MRSYLVQASALSNSKMGELHGEPFLQVQRAQEGDHSRSSVASIIIPTQMSVWSHYFPTRALA